MLNVNAHVLYNSFVEINRLNFHDLTSSKTDNINDQENLSQKNNNHKFNSLPMRLKKGNNKLLKEAKSSSSSINDYKTTNTTDDVTLTAATLTEEELDQLSKSAYNNKLQENIKLKQFLRSNYWSIRHPIRNYLWRCLLKQTSSTGGGVLSPHKSNGSNSVENKENNGKIQVYCSESEYNQHLNHIFGKSRDIEVSLPDFANIPSCTQSEQTSHQNYYYLNSEGKQAIKRILCVYEYHNPQVTFSPGLVSISSILLHFMKEHEVFGALCLMSSTKEHLIESKSSWDATCSVFSRLLKSYSKTSYEIISKYATDSLDSIFNEWYWWIFDCLSFEYLVKIMDCFLYEGQKVFYRVSLAIVKLFTRVIKSQNIKVDKFSIKQFCQSQGALPSIDKLLKVSFSIRNLKRSTINDFFQKEEIKKKLKSTTNQPIPIIQINNDKPMSTNDHSPNHIFLKEASTSVLSHSNLSTLWSWIPQRLSVYNPNMLYTSQEHGTSVNTLLNVLDELEYCIIVVKTFQDEIFGAFCSGLWNDRKKQGVNFFGTGETFLFTIAPEKKIFKWIGTKTKTTPSQELFLRIDGNKIAIGGGSHDGLSIKTNLIEGTTNTCDTFENEPLCSQNNFEVAILEVIAFQ